MITTDSVCHFMHGFASHWFVECPGGANYTWNADRTGGRNSIQRYCGKYSDWKRDLKIERGKSHGNHKVGEFCGESVVIIERVS